MVVALPEVLFYLLWFGTASSQDSYISTWDGIPDNLCPSGCKCLDKGSILECRWSTLTRIPPLLSTTIVLDLDYNRINIIHNNSLISAQHTEMISMEHNGVIHIEAGAFEPLVHLRVVRLGDNHLSYLPRDLFRRNRLLNVLDLHGNAFVEIPDNIMYHLHSLKVLNMSYNHLMTPMLGVGFKYTTQLSSLDLSGNNFMMLDAHIFQATLWWDEDVHHFLNLSHCNIRHIHPNALSQLYRLEVLSLDGNDEIPQNDLKMALHDLEVSSLLVLNLSRMNITDISEFFNRFQHRNLLHLDLSSNNLQQIKGHSFYYLTNLKTLDLSRNELRSVGDLSGLGRLEHLSLAYNAIRHLGHTDFEGLQALQALDLSHNALTVIENEPFEKLWDLHTLDVSCNRVSTFTITSGLENLEELNLASNMIVRLSSIRRLLRLKSLDLSSNLITKLDRVMFSRGHNLAIVNFSRNAISEIDASTFSNSAQEVLDLSYNRLTNVSNYGWCRLKQLHLQGNLITNVSMTAFQSLTTLLSLDMGSNNLRAIPRPTLSEVYNLKRLTLRYNALGDFLQQPESVQMVNLLWKLEYLDISHTGLDRLPNNMFVNLSLLQELDVSGNKLSSLPMETSDTLQRLSLLNLSDNLIRVPNPRLLLRIPGLKLLDLSDNPFQCTCELMPFRNWIAMTNLTIASVGDFGRYRCTGPPEWKGISLRDFRLQSNTCSHRERAVIYTTIGCTLLVVIFMAMCATYRYKWWRNHPKLVRTQYSVITESSLVSVNPHRQDNREWV